MTPVAPAAAAGGDGSPALPPRWAADPFLLDERRWWRPALVRTAGEAMLLVQRSTGASGATMLMAVGPAEPVAALVRAHHDATHRFAWVETAAFDLLHAHDVERLGLHPRRTGWEWLVTETAPPPVAAEGLVRELDPVADADAIRACLAEANPTTEADPTAPGERWWGVVAGDAGDGRGPGGPARLGGVIGAGPRAGRAGPRTGEGGPGSAHLHGLGVRPGERGRGLGAALTAAATRALLADGADWVSLGMWDDNDGARRIYHRLGLRTAHRLTTLRRD